MEMWKVILDFSSTSIRGKPRFKVNLETLVQRGYNEQVVPFDPPVQALDDFDREDIGAFLRKKGSIEMLIVVSEGGATYTEMVEKTRLADSTLNTRRAQAVELGLIKGDSKHVDGQVKRIYVLTPLGLGIRWYIHNIGMSRVFWRLQELRDQYGELSEEVIEWVEDDDSEFEQQSAKMLTYDDFDYSQAEHFPWE